MTPEVKKAIETVAQIQCWPGTNVDCAARVLVSEVERLREGVSEIRKVCLTYPLRYRDRIHLECRVMLRDDEDGEEANDE